MLGAARRLPVLEEDAVHDDVRRSDVDPVLGADLRVVVADAAVDAAADHRDVGGAFDEEAEHVDVAQGDVVGIRLGGNACRDAHVADFDVVADEVEIGESDTGTARGLEDNVAAGGLARIGVQRLRRIRTSRDLDHSTRSGNPVGTIETLARSGLSAAVAVRPARRDVDARRPTRRRRRSGGTRACGRGHGRRRGAVTGRVHCVDAEAVRRSAHQICEGVRADRGTGRAGGRPLRYVL